MNCQDYREKIGPLLMEDLKADERTRLKQHLEGCSGCRRELELLSETLNQLSSLPEVAIPHHFFVAPQQPSLGPLQLMARLSPLWKGVFAVLALALLATGALAVSGLQVRIDQGALLAGFGSLPSERPTGLTQDQATDLVAALLQSVERRMQQRDEAVTAGLRQQLSRFRTDLDREQKEGIEALLADFENRMARIWQEGDTRLRSDVRDYVKTSQSDAQIRYRQDLAALGRQLEEFALRDDIQDERISLVSSAFMKIMEGVE